MKLLGFEASGTSFSEFCKEVLACTMTVGEEFDL